jgi:HAD superfamily hydrolase (TIGR01459 family)
MTRIISSLDEIAADYDALFCDLWGCLHNGIAPFPEAVSALQGFRAGGGRVVLLTNAPRPRHEVETQLDGMGVPRDCWDVIATSGDSARLAMFQGAVGDKVYFIGEERDLSFFEPIHLLDPCPEVQRVRLQEATGIVCTGPRDPHADPSVHRGEFLLAKTKGLRLLCANPDIVVDRGHERIWCAGALAALYDEMGGESLYF